MEISGTFHAHDFMCPLLDFNPEDDLCIGGGGVTQTPHYTHLTQIVKQFFKQDIWLGQKHKLYLYLACDMHRWQIHPALARSCLTLHLTKHKLKELYTSGSASEAVIGHSHYTSSQAAQQMCLSFNSLTQRSSLKLFFSLNAQQKHQIALMDSHSGE